MEEKTEHFRWNFDVNVFKLLGSQLISDKFTAIIELVKNSYDANATEVKIDFINSQNLENGQIILKDNGLGMSKKDIETKWMKIGTNSKRNKKVSPEPYNRVLLGEKGIGRFAIEKIADHISLMSKQKQATTIHELIIDWSDYHSRVDDEDPELFTNIQNQYIPHPADEIKVAEQFTSLTFTNLKESWTSTDIKRLKRELAKLISPIQIDYKYHEFKILVKEDEGDTLFDVNKYEEVRNDSLKYASTVYEIGFDRNSHMQEELRFNEDLKAMEIHTSNEKPFGPIKIKLFYFDADDKRAFSRAYKGKEQKIDGFKIYRDSVLATPFVEIASSESGVDMYRDILGIDKRRWSNFFGKISSHDFIGFIEISKEANPGIRDLTNRQDFEDTPQYREFKEFIINQLQQIEKALEEQKKQERKNKENKLDNALKELKEVKSKLESVSKFAPEIANEISPAFSILKDVSLTIRNSSKEIRDLQKNIERQEQVHFSLMSLQEYAADIAHMVRNSLDKIINFSEYLSDKLIDTEHFSKAKLIQNEMIKLNEDVNYMLKYAESGDQLKQFDVAGLIYEVFRAYDFRFQKSGINVEITRPDIFLIVHNKTLLRDVFNNLINNSLKALENCEYKKIIKCSAYRENEEYIVVFSDNGVGIPEENRKLIFDRYFSTTKDEGGSGLGLFIVKNNLKTFKGTIDLIESEFKDKGTTFKITIPIKEEND